VVAWRFTGKIGQGGCQNAINDNKQLIIKTISEEKSAGNPILSNSMCNLLWEEKPSQQRQHKVKLITCNFNLWSHCTG